VLGAPAVLRGRFTLFGQDHKSYSARTIDIVKSTAVLDMLGLLTLDWDKLESWQTDPKTFGASDFERLKDSGINVFHPAVEPNQPNPFEATCQWVNGWNRLISSLPEYFIRVDSVSNIQQAKIEGKAGVVLGFQNSEHFRTTGDVSYFHEMGQRVSQLTYNSRNALGDGCVERRDRGLSYFGAAVIDEMNRVGMAVDVSHAGERTALDAIAASKSPVLITHTNCKALVPRHPRCVSDDVIRALAAAGGVMGITDIPSFVWHDRPVTIDHLLDHYEHVVRLVGVEFVGIGSDSDLDGVDRPRARKRENAISGLNLARRVYDVTEGLFARGYTERHLEQILGANFTRVLDQAWAPKAIS
jgi:membrane dipeptidase